ncbi:glycosyltransferase family 9 protein [Desulfobulbus sp.]|uniref:glycosyltransferase family 9 protein n=1 Tax=Desulfobulbus sp. TaxID=895 RepID=UPI00286F8853|nr:glycosyltransferase family 9 protein [Desulfobulbus sp.]
MDNLDGKHILFIKQSSLGDIVHALPVAHALKRCFPECHLGWIVERGLETILERDPAIERIHPIHIPSTSEPGVRWPVYFRALSATAAVLRGLRRRFRSEPYDLILDLHASFRSGLFALMNPGGTRIGFGDARELNPLFQHHLLKEASRSMHAVEKNLLFCHFLGCAPRKEDFYLATGPADEQQAADFLKASGIAPGQRFVYLNPAARWQSKFWIPARWSALCDRLEVAGVRTVFGGSPDDLVHIEPIVAAMGHGGARIAAGRLSLMASVALMKAASAYVGVDTGPMHIAAMVGTPVVAVFGPTHPERVGPYGVNNAVVRAEGLDCLCCRKRDCGHQRCMEGITVDMVYDRTMALIAPITPG